MDVSYELGGDQLVDVYLGIIYSIPRLYCINSHSWDNVGRYGVNSMIDNAFLEKA